MNSLIIEKFSDDEITLSSEVSTHLREILKVSVGDSLKATILDQGLGTCEVTECSKNIKVKITQQRAGLHFPIEVILGASRPPTMKKVLEHGSSLGISKFHILLAELSQKSYLQSKIYHESEFEILTRLGISQSAVFYKQPKIEKHYGLENYDLNIEQRYILSPYADNHIKDLAIDITKPSLFAIGPERGWTSSELEKFKKLKFKEIKLSPSILRVEIATFSLMGYLNQLM